MPRPIFVSEIYEPQGTEPQLVLAIEYPISIQWYATKTLSIDGVIDCDGAIVSAGAVSSQIKKSNASTASTVSITLSDIYGNVKLGLDTVVFEKTQASLYLHYVGTGTIDLIPLVKGNICGPAVWDETTRNITFTIESPIQDKDFGYAPTVQDIPSLDPQAQGIAWPMVFGKCAHVPAVKIKSRAEGALIFSAQLYSTTPFNASGANFILNKSPDVYSFNVDASTKNKLYIDQLPTFNQSTSALIIDGVIFKGSIDATNKTQFNVTEANASKYEPFNFGTRVDDSRDPAHDSKNYSVCWMPDDVKSIANCYIYIGALKAGDPDVFNYCEKQIGRKCWLRYPFVTRGAGATDKYKKVLLTPGYSVKAVYPIPKNGMIHDYEGDAYSLVDMTANRKLAAGKVDANGALAAVLQKAQLDPSSWWHVPADTLVLPYSSSDTGDVYVASLITLASVKAVYGKQKTKDYAGKTKEILVPLPQNYYSVTLSSSMGPTGFHATTFKIDPPLKTYQDQGWGDTVYVTGTSTVGPNPCDIIDYIIQNFTTLDTNGSSFSNARGDCRPANFAIFEKREALAVCEEIAYQSRLGLILEQREVSIKFLPTKGIPTFTLNDSNIDVKGGYFQSQTPLPSVRTKYVSTWGETYKERKETLVRHNSRLLEVENIVRSLIPDQRRSKSETRYYMYQKNTIKFGTKVQTTAVYIFNEGSPVKEVTDFWGGRGSRVWRRAKIKTFVSALTVQPFDTVLVSMVDQTMLYAGSLTGNVLATSFNYSDMSVMLDIEFPVEAGTALDLSSDFWPGNTYTETVPTYGALVWASDANS